jgi:hypothetical protein
VVNPKLDAAIPAVQNLHNEMGVGGRWGDLYGGQERCIPAASIDLIWKLGPTDGEWPNFRRQIHCYQYRTPGFAPSSKKPLLIQIPRLSIGHASAPTMPSERCNREIRRRTRVVGAFPEGNSALMLVCARLRCVAGTQWG